MNEARTRPRLYHGWAIVAISFVLLAVSSAMWYDFAVFLVALEQKYGWDRVTLTTAFSINMIVGGLASPLVGRLGDRLGFRAITTLGTVILGLGLIGMGLTHDLFQFYLLYGVIVAIGMTFIGVVPISAVINNWFVRRRATALGLALSGVGAGVAVFVPLTQYLISNLSWESALYVLGAASLMLTVPTYWLIRQRPPDLELPPSEAVDDFRDRASGRRRKNRGTPTNIQEGKAVEWSLGLALRSYLFWLMFFVMTASVFANQAVLVHQNAYLIDKGYTPMLAASALGFIGITGAAGRVFWGWISDRIGREVAYTFGVVGAGVAVVLLLMVGGVSAFSLVWGYAIIFGFMYSAHSPLYSAMSADVFHGPNFGTIFGVLYLGVGIGAAFGPWFAGFTYKVTGNYSLAFVFSIILDILSCASVWLLARHRARSEGMAKAFAEGTTSF